MRKNAYLIGVSVWTCSIALGIGWSGCEKHQALAGPRVPPAQVQTANYQTDSLPVSHLFSLTDSVPWQADSIGEISGLAHASDKGHDRFWGEEDSGNRAALYLLDQSGNLLGIQYLDGLWNRDWEDIAGARGEQGDYELYLADIGDNLQIFPFITVYRFTEPNPDPTQWKDSLIQQFDVINLFYPDGPHNAEALMVDPLSRDIYIVTKGDSAGLYVARYPQSLQEAQRMDKMAILPLTGVTAADISPDGRRILIKNYQDIFYWDRQDGEAITDCLQRAPQKLAYDPEPQGEALAWNLAGDAFYTLSEKVSYHPVFLFHYSLY
jgi:hypothetical protein